MIFLYNGHSSEGVNSTLSARPKIVNVGCMLSFNTVVGKITKVAVEAAWKLPWKILIPIHLFLEELS